MSTKLELRYVPLWLSNVFDHYGCDANSFESIVSKHDLKLYKIANNLLRVKLAQMLVVADFEMPDADLSEQYDGADALFSVFGQNPDGKALPQFLPRYFNFVPAADTHGVWMVEAEVVPGQEKDLVLELLNQIALYKGKDKAYASESFRRYLSSVKKESVDAQVS